MSLSSDRIKLLGRGKRRPWLSVERLEDRCVPATILVTSLADNLTVDGQVTLREAIQAANTNASVDGSAAGTPYAGTPGTIDVIGFAPGVSGTISLNLGELTISEPVNVLGP